MTTILSITGIGSNAIIQADSPSLITAKGVSFPLTKRGCMKMGEFLFNSQVSHWLCSSSIDFPREIKPSFKYDVRDLLDSGWKDACKKQGGKPDESLGHDESVSHERIGEWEIYGNAFVAIMINVHDPSDSYSYSIGGRRDSSYNAFDEAMSTATNFSRPRKNLRPVPDEF